MVYVRVNKILLLQNVLICVAPNFGFNFTLSLDTELFNDEPITGC